MTWSHILHSDERSSLGKSMVRLARTMALTENEVWDILKATNQQRRLLIQKDFSPTLINERAGSTRLLVGNSTQTMTVTKREKKHYASFYLLRSMIGPPLPSSLSALATWLRRLPGTYLPSSDTSSMGSREFLLPLMTPLPTEALPV